jgi:hypothetical protein
MNYYISLLLIFVLSASRSNSQKLIVKDFDTYANLTTPADSTLQSLQKKNEVLLVYAIEDYAWTKSTAYHVLASNDNSWKSYYYKVANKSTFLEKSLPVEARTAVVAKTLGDSLLANFTREEVWKIKGDNNQNFCQTSSSKNYVAGCNITDQPTYKLMMITKTKMYSSSYYAPEFFEKCCPGDKDRKKFLKAVHQILNLISASQQGTSNK